MSLLKVFPDEPLEAKSVTPGKGDRAVKTGDNLRVHYTGWTDGFKGKNQFDSSQGRMPFPVKLGADQVIPGWEQGLLGMKVGEVRHLKIPHYLGYGNQDKGKIKPYSTLFFEVELVEFIEPGELKAETTKQGSGEPAKAGEKVRVHYSGWLDGFNGKIKFDSSRDPGRQPFDFNLGKAEVIPGWDKGVEGMKPGEVRRLTVPYNLAYGEPGRAPTIPPFATLYFEVEYLGKTPEAMPSPAGSPSPGGTPTP
ncbi:MAG: FKBP-type peptidyl-prolyl cis-trans isomerase [Armatimonadetes bacterium]|nr:FKBP-type peptidyl-prolyl cis-trans isomerase [Armatimonadota bacterium]